VCENYEGGFGKCEDGQGVVWCRNDENASFISSHMKRA
jgi:hypothetical protein